MSSPISYAVREVPQSDTVAHGTLWAVEVRLGADDPTPQVLAYAVAEHLAHRICLALRQSNRLAQQATRAAANAYVGGRDASAEPTT